MIKIKKTLSLVLVFAMLMSLCPLSVSAADDGKQYIVSFVNYDGSPISSEKLSSGATPTAPANPTRKDDTRYTYTFDGWDKEIVPVGEDNVVYTATYTSANRPYQVTWVYGDQTQTVTARYGETPVEPANPTKAADNNYTYTFSHWAPTVGAVTGDTTYTAVFNKTARTYPVTWMVGDSARVDELSYGTTPVYQGTVPTASGKVFLGWSTDSNATKPDELGGITKAETYFPVYADVESGKVTVTFRNSTGYVISRQQVTVGELPVKPANPQQTNERYEYTFTGWTPEIVPASKDATYTAQFERSNKRFTITWLKDDGSVLTSNTKEYGARPDAITPTVNPTKKADEWYTYTFSGWQPSVTAVVGDATYAATFTRATRRYTLNWMNGDSVLQTDNNVPYDSLSSYRFNGSTPTRAATDKYRYIFSDWKPFVDTTNGVINMNAQFVETLQEYNVRFINYDGTVLDEQWVEYGAIPEYWADPAREPDEAHTYTFAGWSPAPEAVTKDAIYAATYNAAPRQYTVTFYDEDGETVLSSEKYDYGTAARHIVQPSPRKPRQGTAVYVFDRWEPTVNNVTGDATYIAAYKEATVTYDITWLNEDGSVFDTTTVAHGDVPTHSGPSKAMTVDKVYTFDKWVDKDGNEPAAITGPATYSPTYYAEPRTYNVTWVNGATTVTEQVVFDEMPKPLIDNPERASDSKFDYAFAGWLDADGKQVHPVNADVTYSAQYTPSNREYTVTFVFKDSEGIEKERSTAVYHYDDMPVFSSPLEVAPSAEYTYEFDSWDNAFQTVIEDRTYTATFTREPRLYTVIWKDGDKYEVEKDYEQPYDTALHSYDSADPTISPNPRYVYTWKGALEDPSEGWSKPEINLDDGTITYTADFDRKDAVYEIKFTGYDNDPSNPLKTETLTFGDDPTPPTPPEKPKDDQYTYEFANWTPEVVPVDGPATYYPVYIPTTRSYTVTWKNADGTVLETDENVEYGTAPTYDGATPAKKADDEYTYEFDKWTPDVAPVTGDATYTATYRAISSVPLKLVGSYDKTTKTATVAVVAAKPITLSNYDVTLNWDGALFTLSDVTNGQEALMSNFIPATATGKIAAATNGNNVTIDADETLASYVLTTDTVLASGDYPFTLTVTDASDEVGEALAWKGQSVDGVLTVSRLSAESFDCRASDAFTLDYTAPAAGDFTVASDQPCIVLYSNGNGYRKLEAVRAGDDTYSFTLPADYSERKKIIIAVKGDINSDGDINSTDALQVLRCSAGLRSFDEVTLLICDINGDSKLTSTDALQLLRVSAELRTLAW